MKNLSISRVNIIGLLTLSLLSLYSCKKEYRETLPSIESIEIINNPSSALAARVIITIQSNATVQVSLRNKEGSTIMYSRISENRKRHEFSLLYLKENTKYELEITVKPSPLTEKVYSEKRSFTTAKIPKWVTDFYDEKANQIDDPLEGYYLFASMGNPGCIYMINNRGRLVWYQTTKAVVKSVHMTEKGTILALLDENGTHFGDGNVVLETSLTNDTLFVLKHNQKGFDKWIHHDLKRTPSGNIVAITNTFKNGLPGDGLVKWGSSGNKIWEWSTFDVADHIPSDHKEQPWINSIFIDHDGHYILSLRALNQVWKINSSTGNIIWKLGRNGNLKIDRNAEFLRQHYAHRNKEGHIMLFDNGSDERPYSRVLSFEINEKKLSAEKKIDIKLPHSYYSPIMGSCSLLPDNTVLVASSTTHSAIKVGEQGTPIWSLKFNNQIYRIEYIDPSFFSDNTLRSTIF